MLDSINIFRKLAATMLVATAAAVAVPAVHAWDGPPDAIDRYTNPAALAWDGPPDAIDRYRESQQFAALATTRPGFQGNPDAIDRYLGRTAAPAASASVGDGFAWNEFGIGAGVMLGAVLLLVGISLGALAVRHRSGSLSTS